MRLFAASLVVNECQQLPGTAKRIFSRIPPLSPNFNLSNLTQANLSVQRQQNIFLYAFYIGYFPSSMAFIIGAPNIEDSAQTASVSSSQETAMTEESPLTRLPSELKRKILKNLRSNDWLSLRLTCRRFYDIATPFIYETVDLTLKPDIGGLNAFDYYSNSRGNIFRFTRHVKLGDTVQPHRVEQLIASVDRLISVTWRVCTLTKPPGYKPSTLLNVDRMIADDTKLHFERMRLDELNDGTIRRPFYLEGINPRLIESLKIEADLTRPMPVMRDLADFLYGATQMVEFSLGNLMNKIVVGYTTAECRRSLVSLRLEDSDWTDPEEHIQEWSVGTPILELKLFSINLYRFLVTINQANFSKLNSLTIDNDASVDYERQQGLQLLHSIIKTRACNLKKLSLIVDIHKFPVDAILRHADSLKTVDFRYPQRFDYDESLPDISLGTLKEMQSKLTLLENLELDIVVDDQVPVEFLRILARFPNMQTISLKICIKSPIVHGYEEPQRVSERGS
ncbi:hypothetical protein PT974_01375 [Cladobotryum mycophilum]|uniref:F-box domain-containing protein n=1 Tax=Cladobotryum mycophilum TaxID=491253 RepID=A0ABR0T4N2_9HYPO